MQEPVPFWGFMGDLLEGLGYGRPRIKLPALLILFLAIVFEWVGGPHARVAASPQALTLPELPPPDAAAAVAGS
jgi:sterol-4alpha-carboxylate 3-dehydrogenase (decarboxylating)